MKRWLSALIVKVVILFAISAMAQEFQWPMFLPAVINAGSQPVTVTSAGQIWMDRNLGASRVATNPTDSAAYGDLYQWGRLTDGHEKSTSATTSTLSTSDIPGHGSFILVSSSPYDWRASQSNSLWQGVSGTNNPCPSGFRLPTEMEFDIERASWNSIDAAGAFASPLKLTVAGLRSQLDGTIIWAGSFGYYWSSTVSGTQGGVLIVQNRGAFINFGGRANGISVRCIKD